MAKKAEKKQLKGKNPSGEQEDRFIAESISALKNTIADKADAGREEAAREDKGNKYLETATLCFVILTTGGIFYQAHILNNTDHTIKQSMIGDQRAYIIFSDTKFTDETPGKQRIGYIIRNIGKTPVYNLEQTLFLDILTPPVANYSGIKVWTPTTPIAYSGPVLNIQDIESRGFSQKEMDGIKSASIYTNAPRLYFIGRATYEDVFKQKRCTNFCFMYVKESGGRFSYCESLNKADQNDSAASCDAAFAQ